MELKSLANEFLLTISRNEHNLQIFNTITDLTPFYLAVNEYGIINQYIIKALNTIKKYRVSGRFQSNLFLLKLQAHQMIFLY